MDNLKMALLRISELAEHDKELAFGNFTFSEVTAQNSLVMSNKLLPPGQYVSVTTTIFIPVKDNRS